MSKTPAQILAEIIDKRRAACRLQGYLKTASRDHLKKHYPADYAEIKAAAIARLESSR